MVPESILVVGAGLAGARCAETLRAEGYDGSLTLVGDELLPPYERPALSKEFLAGTKSERELLLRPPSSWSEQEIDLRLGQRVAHIDPIERTATTEAGDELAWDALVLATGARPRLLPFPAPRGVHTLRTVVEAKALRAALVPGAHLVVVGGGFVGAEVASTALALGVRVTMLEALATPFERTLGPTLGRMLADRYRSYGVDLRVRTGATGFGADSAAVASARCGSRTGARSAATSLSSASASSRPGSSSRVRSKACRSSPAATSPAGLATGQAPRPKRPQSHGGSSAWSRIPRNPPSSGPTSSAFGSSLSAARSRAPPWSSKAVERTSSPATTTPRAGSSPHSAPTGPPRSRGCDAS